MNIALHDADKTKFPNLALMKLSAYHQSRGDAVTWFDPLFSAHDDTVYSSKVFSYTSVPDLPQRVERGGTGYRLLNTLPDAIEHTCPDYALYGVNYSVGFVTRGCPRSCPWCIVPQKEGAIRAHADVREFLRHKELILMDNNILAHPHGLKQIEELKRLKVKVDFNQGLDARLIDDSTAKLLYGLKWRRFTRMSCDTTQQIAEVERAIRLLRWHNVNPAQLFVYCLVEDIGEALERVKALKGLYVHIFAQPYRDQAGTPPPQDLVDFARWVNHKAIFKSIPWEDYRRGTPPRENRAEQLDLLAA